MHDPLPNLPCADHENPEHMAALAEALVEMPEGTREWLLTALAPTHAAAAESLRRAISAQERDELESRLRIKVTSAAPRSAPASADAPEISEQLTSEQRTPEQLGPYRILERIGQGGFGEVFVAEQEQPVRRRVAVKILKAGVGSREVIARFELERQALALMEHPNIAGVLDAGSTPLGLPYIVMELVRGRSITDFCNEQRLTLRERLELMIPVCDAVRHAHQRGIIHRDLKPSNVLVTLVDGKAIPKVIDFGIAKVIGPAIGDSTVYTEFRQLLGTPAYMSPEQLSLAAADIDTRSDVYAIGALLYEIVSGRPPFENEALLRTGLDGLRRMIRETDPPKPSTRVLAADPETRAALALSRRCAPEQLGRQLEGEVDWIVLKATEKERARRYQSAGELAADLHAFLRGEAVTAGPPSGWYRLRKHASRHRGAVIAALLAMVGLLATTIGTGIGLRREAAARRDAEASERAALESQAGSERSAAVAQTALDFLPRVLRTIAPDRGERREMSMQEILECVAAAADGNGDAQQTPLLPEAEIDVRRMIASLYFGLGHTEQARIQAGKALTLAEELYGPESPLLFPVLDVIAWGEWSSGSAAESERAALRAVAIAEKNGLQGGRMHHSALNALSLGRSKGWMYKEAMETALERIELNRAIGGSALEAAYFDAAMNSFNLGRAEDAHRYALLSTDAHRDAYFAGRAPPLFDGRFAFLAAVELVLDRGDEAERLVREVGGIAEHRLGPSMEHRILIRVLIERGHPDEAEEQLRRYALARAERLSSPVLTNFELLLHALLARRQGRHSEAIGFFRQYADGEFGPAWIRPVSGTEHRLAAAEHCGALTDLGRPVEGLRALRPVFDETRADAAGSGDDHADHWLLRRMAAELLRACEAIGDAESLEQAGQLRSAYPGLEPAPGFTPLP